MQVLAIRIAMPLSFNTHQAIRGFCLSRSSLWIAVAVIWAITIPQAAGQTPLYLPLDPVNEVNSNVSSNSVPSANKSTEPVIRFAQQPEVNGKRSELSNSNASIPDGGRPPNEQAANLSGNVLVPGGNATSNSAIRPETKPDVKAAAIPEALPLTIEMIQSRLQQIQNDAALPPPTKQSLIQIYESILLELRAKAESERLIKELMTSAEAAPSATIEAKRRKENPPARDLISENALRSYPLQALQSLLQTQQTNLQAATDGRTKTDTALTTREGRRKELPRLIAEERATLQKLNDELNAPASTETVAPTLREAQQLLLRAKLAATTDRVRKLEQEQRTYDAEAELLPLRKELYTSDERYFQARVKEINDELNKRRETKIEEERRKAEALAASAPAELKWLADRLVKRAAAWLQLAKDNTAIQLEIEQAKAKEKFWDERYRIMTDRSKTNSEQSFGVINNWNGLLLRRHRNELPDETKMNNQLQDNLSRMQKTETLIIELEDWKNQNAVALLEDADLSDVEANGVLGTKPIPPLSPSLLNKADALLAAERELVNSFAIDAASYSDNLYALSETKQSTIRLVKKYRDFIDQHVLWIRSANPFAKSDFRQLWLTIQWFFDYRQWQDAGSLLLHDFRQRPWEYLFFFAVWGYCFHTSAGFDELSSGLGKPRRRPPPSSSCRRSKRYCFRSC